MDPNYQVTGKKLKLVKKQAREQAKQKELEEQLIRQIQRSEVILLFRVSIILFSTISSHVKAQTTQ